MGQDVTLLLCALAFSTATLGLSKAMLRLSTKAGLPNQAAWIYLPVIASMATTLTRLGVR